MEHIDPGPVGEQLRAWRKDQSTVPEAWHPFDLRNKPESVAAAPALAATSYSAIAVMEAIGHEAGAGGEGQGVTVSPSASS